MLRKITFVLSTLLALLIAALLICAVFAVPISLTPLKGVIELGVTKAISRKVSLGDIKLVPSPQPIVLLRDIHIGNPPGWPQEDRFARIAQAKAKVELWSLIRGDLDLQWVRGEGIELVLAENTGGEPNWRFQPSENDDTSDEHARIPLSNVKELLLKQVTVRYQKADDTAPDSVFQLDEFSTSAATDTAFALNLQGRCLQQPCAVSARLERSETSLRLTPLQGHLGDSTLTGQAIVDLSEEAMVLDAQLDISSLDNRLLQLWWRDADLGSPIEGITLRARGQGADLKALVGNLDISLRAGSSRLSLERKGRTPLTLALSGTELTLAPGKPLQISTGGRLNDLPLGLGIAVDLTELARQSETGSFNLPVKLTGTAGESRISADGNIARHSEQFMLDLHIHADGPQFGKLTAMLIDTETPMLPYRIDTQVQYAGNTVKLDKLDAEIGASALQGALSISNIGTPEQRLDAKLHAPVIDLTLPVTETSAKTIPQKVEASIHTAQQNTAAKAKTNNKESLKQARDAEAALRLDKKQKRLIQTALTQLGFNTRGVDGIFGKNTRSAIQDFQESRQQTPSGYLNAEQLAVLLNGTSKPPKAKTTSTPQGGESLTQAQQSETALKLDKKQKRQVQIALTELGFNTRGSDGVFGKNTRSAIQAFQESQQQTPSGFLNAEQLALLLDDKKPAPATVGPPTLLEQPLPTGLTLIDSDLEVSVERLILPQNTEISALSFIAKLQGGYLSQSSLQATLGGHPFTGNLMVDLRNKAAKLQVNLNAKKLDIGSLLRSLQIAEDIDLHADQLNTTLSGEGETLGELLNRSSVDATLTGGRWIVDSSMDKKDATINLVSSTLKARPEQALLINSDVRYRDTPLTLTLQGESLEKTLQTSSWPVKLSAKSKDGALALNGSARLPLSRKQLSAQLELSGKQLDHLGNLFAIALPPLGPYSMTGTLGAEKEGYRLKDLKINIGNSDLQGRLFLATGQQVPSLDLDLQANQIQLVDFGVDLSKTGSQSNVKQTRQPDASPTTLAGLLNDLGLSELDIWLKPELMRRINGNLNLEARRVALDASALGTGPYSILASLQDGRLSIRRGLVNLAGGTLDIQIALQPDANGLEAELKSNIDRFDYGALARQLDPGSAVDGHLTFNSALRARTPKLDSFLAHANGSIGFILQPTALEAGPLSLWELNLLTLLLPVLDAKESKLNCVVGHFLIEDGVVKVKPGALTIDTSKIRASGEGEINFKTQNIEMTLIPKVKSPGILDLATPVKISGNFSDFGTSLPPGGLIRKAAELSLAVNALWLQFFNWEEVPPADGSDVCNSIPPLVTNQPEPETAVQR